MSELLRVVGKSLHAFMFVYSVTACSLLCPTLVKQCLIEETCTKPFLFGRFGNES